MGIPSEYLANTQYAFHTTTPENIEQIQKTGIRPDTENTVTSNDIISTLRELGCENAFPFNREDVVYCHTDGEYVSETTLTPTDTRFQRKSVVVVVDVNEIDAPRYVGDMSIITDLIDYRYTGESGMIHADTPLEAVEKYRESIIRVESDADIESFTGTHAELVVDGTIPPTAIQTVLTA